MKKYTEKHGYSLHSERVLRVGLQFIDIARVLDHVASFGIPKRRIAKRAGITPPYLSQLTAIDDPEVVRFMVDHGRAGTLKNPSDEIIKGILHALKEELDCLPKDMRERISPEIWETLERLCDQYGIQADRADLKFLSRGISEKVVSLLLRDKKLDDEASNLITITGPYASGKSAEVEQIIRSARETGRFVLSVDTKYPTEEELMLNFQTHIGVQSEFTFADTLAKAIDTSPHGSLIVVEHLNLAPLTVYEEIRKVLSEELKKHHAKDFLFTHGAPRSIFDIQALATEADRFSDLTPWDLRGFETIVSTGWFTKKGFNQLAGCYGVSNPKDLSYLWEITRGQPFLASYALRQASRMAKRAGEVVQMDSALQDSSNYEPYYSLMREVLIIPQTSGKENLLRAFGVHPDQAGYPKISNKEAPELHKKWFGDLV